MERSPAAISKAQFTKAIKTPNSYVKVAVDEQNTSKWYALLVGIWGSEGEYQNGEYLVEVILPDDFPFKPPEFYFKTPNGVYGVDKKVCISIGTYHADNYRATLGVMGFVNNLVSGLIGWQTLGSGIELVQTTAAQKKKMANESAQFNRKHYGAIIDKINDSYEGYSKKWPK